jgi:hypothetical protein
MHAGTIFDDTIRELQSSGEALDAERLVALLAPDIIVRSPITQLIRFDGIEQARDLFRRIFSLLGPSGFYQVVGGGSSTQVIFSRGSVDGVYLEEANLIRMNAEGKIVEMTVFMRAVPGLLQLASRIAPSLATRHGRGRSVFIRAQFTILARIYRAAEPMAIRLIGAGVPVPKEFSNSSRTGAS